MSASVNIGCTDSYHPGFQKQSLIGDPTFRSCACLFILYSAIAAAASRFMPPNQLSIVEASLQLGLIFPFALRMSGGLPADCRKRYIAFCAFALCGILPAMMFHKYASLALIPFVAAILFDIARRAPGTFRNMGFKPLKMSFDEVVFFVGSLALMMTLTGFAFERIEGVRADFRAPAALYATYFIYGIIFYGSSYCAMYGVLSRRALDMKLTISAVIALNIGFHFLLAFPMAPYFGSFGLWVAGEISGAIMSQFFLGVMYYKYRSMSAVILQYVLYYVFYSIIFMAR